MFFSLRFGLTLFFINDFLKFDLWAFFFFLRLKTKNFLRFIGSILAYFKTIMFYY